nr:hypothetical protein [Nanoarchaeota archaeon]
MNAALSAIISFFKKVHNFVTSIINFVFVVPMYFLGAGISRIFYKEEKREPEQLRQSYWNVSKQKYTKQSFERMF